MTNLAGKMRKTGNPYAIWTDPRSGFEYHLLKSWQADNNKPYARWFVHSNHDLGDEYVWHLRPGLLAAEDLAIDISVFGSFEFFLQWVKGE